MGNDRGWWGGGAVVVVPCRGSSPSAYHRPSSSVLRFSCGRRQPAREGARAATSSSTNNAGCNASCRSLLLGSRFRLLRGR